MLHDLTNNLTICFSCKPFRSDSHHFSHIFCRNRTTFDYDILQDRLKFICRHGLRKITFDNLDLRHFFIGQILSSLVYVQSGSIFSLSGHNKALWLAFGASLLSTLAVIYIPPLARAFQFETVSLEEYAVAVLLALAIIPMVEIVKAFLRRNNKDVKKQAKKA